MRSGCVFGCFQMIQEKRGGKRVIAVKTTPIEVADVLQDKVRDIDNDDHSNNE